MDRGRHRAILIALMVGSGCAACTLSALRAGAEPTPTPPPPSVQATPAPKPSAIPPENMPGGGNRGGRIKAAMMEARQREEAEVNAPGGGSNAAARLAKMTPEEREAFNRNLKVWRDIPPDERQDLRKQANDRNREEIREALRDSGLRLDNDQKEVFALRYLQERRKLERQIQDQTNAERARRLPEILERLKREFDAKKTATPAPSVAPTPLPSPSAKPPGN